MYLSFGIEEMSDFFVFPANLTPSVCLTILFAKSGAKIHTAAALWIFSARRAGSKPGRR
jgi:hypothetical protein